MSGRTGVVISTTGDEHRMRFLETSVAYWKKAVRMGDLFVTVDGSVDDTLRVTERIKHLTDQVYQVGQPHEFTNTYGVPIDLGQPTVYSGRLGVAVNKNTGLELLIDQTDAEHLFLSDDDTWPVLPQALDKHRNLGIGHSMVCWGKSRLDGYEGLSKHIATWTWPRGVMLYANREVVYNVGGMDERFGPGGHEHVEWSNRIHNAGLTPAPFCSPAVYSLPGEAGGAMRASTLWHCEDMRRRGEPVGEHQQRRKALTSIRREDRDWDHITQIMNERKGHAGYVPFRAHQNARSSATLSANLMGQGAGGEK